ncbi:MAG: sensor histidine kinase [Planctomycetota bacterium]
MRLRPRLVLGMLLTALPLAGGAWWLHAHLARRHMDDALREFGYATMENGGRTRCEEDPERFVVDTRRPPPPPREERGPPRPGRRGPPPPRRPRGNDGPPDQRATRLWAYDATYRSLNPRSPPFPPELAEALDAGEQLASRRHTNPDGEGRQVALRMPWQGTPCDVVLVERAFPDESFAGPLLLGAIGALALGLLVVVWVTAGPLVVRLRRLARGVAQSATTGFLEPVPATGSDEIADVANAFNDAAAANRAHVEQLAAREATLRDFVANTTHDVMVPLSVLQGHLGTLRRHALKHEAADPTVLDGAMGEAQHVASLLHNLGALAKLESGDVHLDLRPVDLVALVERVVARHGSVAASHGVLLEHGVPPEPLEVVGDVTLLEQLVGNVVHNAVRYQDEGGHVAVVVGREGPDAQRFRLRVEDDGPGIPDDELPRAFERSWRGTQARTRRPGGAGLGLSIAKEVADRHGFELSLAARDGGGLVVTLTGPALSS